MTSGAYDPSRSNPPRGYFSVWQRIFRGYGPAVVLALVLGLVAWLVPSKLPDADPVASAPQVIVGGTDPVTGAVTADGAPISGAGSTDVTAGSGTPGGTDGSGAQAAAGVKPCTDRAPQVPGDPYSPACLTFSGNNGGVTTKGVTGKEINVAYRVLDEKGFQQTLAELAGASLSDTPEDVNRTIEALAEYFNTRFEFYGRKIKVNFYKGVGSNTNELLGKGRDKAEADAETVKSMNVFADLSATSEPYADALFRRQVVGFGTPYLSREWHTKRSPYMWSLATDGSIVAEFAAEFAGKRLARGKADFAGGSIKGKPRVIATIAPENSWYQESVAASRARYKQVSGVAPGPNYKYVLDLGTMSNQANNLIPKLQSDGVTTLICGCDPIFPVFLSGAAAREGYYPEFIIVGTALTDVDIVGQLWDKEFASHAFGISSLQAPVPPDQTIAYAAFKSVRPKEEPAFVVDLVYYQMYMMAIGIQQAGPNLTPQTFAKGMFDYPAKLGPVGLWEFGPDDFTPANDVREIYWDSNAISKYNSKKGAYIELNGGKRYKRDELPKGKPPIPAS